MILKIVMVVLMAMFLCGARDLLDKNLSPNDREIGAMISIATFLAIMVVEAIIEVAV